MSGENSDHRSGCAEFKEMKIIANKKCTPGRCINSV